MQRLIGIKKTAASALLTLVVLAGAGAALSACNTVAGLGQDLQDAGQALTGSADRLKTGD